MRRSVQLEGKRFGHLLVLSDAGEHWDLDSRCRRRWRCRCDCGQDCLVLEDNLLSGRSRSCGCRGLWPEPRALDPPEGFPDLAIGMRRARKRAGLSQQELARRSGVSRQSIFSYEHARARPSLTTAIRLAQALSLSLDELLGREVTRP